MKDSRFIELLNLYVDHQISAEDAALLEAEIQRDPKRRRVYREYCQMQKACTILADNFRTQAPATGKIVAFPRTAPRLQIATYAMGALAAAACVALVMVERSRLNEREALAQAGQSVAATAPATATQPVSAPVSAPARVALQPAFAGLVREDRPVNVSLAATTPLDWMNRVQLDRVLAEELWFESRTSTQPSELIFRNPRPVDPQTNMAAFRFQR